MVKVIVEDLNLEKNEYEIEENSSFKDLLTKLNINQYVVCASCEGVLFDLFEKIPANPKLISFLTFDSKEGKHVFWHSSSHILASAVKNIYPDALPTIGPAIENGFYYDFDNLKISDSDLKKIEKEFKKIVHNKEDFSKEKISLKKAKELFSENPYKIELLDEIYKKESNGNKLSESEVFVSVYKNGEFVDLCRGPHISNTKEVKAIKLLKLAGAYWKGNSDNKMLTRIYAISYPTKEKLKEYLTFLEEAKKRDHKKIGKEMDLFSIQEEGPGFPFLHPNGVIMFNTLLDYWREIHKIADYKEIKTPIILSKELWLKSGHWDHYKENMYFTKVDDKDFAVKPMNCPGGILHYKTSAHSYKEFPMRVGEIGLVHRHELSGVLNGLFRVRCFHQDDAHIFMLPNQIENEILGVLNLVDKIYSTFGLEYNLFLSTRPDDFMGDIKDWDLAEESLKSALEKNNKQFTINDGDGAFYGPKIDVVIKDSLGRDWQCATIQLDFQLPQRFELSYMGEDGTNNHRPIMIHRVIYGSVERFMGILIENFAGKFPLWVAPVQFKIIPVSEKFNKYAKILKEKLDEKNIRCEIDLRDETLSKKIREGELQRVNYIGVVGEKEEMSNTVNLRDVKRKKIIGEKKVDILIEELLNEIFSKRL